MYVIVGKSSIRNTAAKTINLNMLRRLGRRFFSLYTHLVLNSYIKLEITGKESLPPKPFIICGNHQSHLDGIVLSYVANRNFRYTSMIAAKDYWFDHKLRSKSASLFFNLIPISRGSVWDYFNINHASAIVEEFLDKGGKAIVILPEGSRSTNGRIGRFKKGITLLAKSVDLPIVPVYISGSGDLWPKGKVFIRPGKISIRIGKPIQPDELDTDADAELIRERIITLQNDG